MKLQLRYAVYGVLVWLVKKKPEGMYSGITLWNTTLYSLLDKIADNAWYNTTRRLVTVHRGLNPDRIVNAVSLERLYHHGNQFYSLYVIFITWIAVWYISTIIMLDCFPKWNVYCNVYIASYSRDADNYIRPAKGRHDHRDTCIELFVTNCSSYPNMFMLMFLNSANYRINVYINGLFYPRP